MTHIIETLGRWGVKSTPCANSRLTRPRAGDVVEFSEDLNGMGFVAGMDDAR